PVSDTGVADLRANAPVSETAPLATALVTFALLLIGCFRSPAQVSQSLGTIFPGEAVTIQYDVTITNNIPAGVTALTNQATFSGGNCSTIVTDDPDTIAANDPTVTLLDVAPAVVTLAASSIGASNVTFNATVTSAASAATVWFEYGLTTS